MVRVTAAEVKQVFKTNEDLNPFIMTASLIVDEELSDQGMSVERLKQIELYLAAHCAAVTHEKGALVSTKVGKSEDEFAQNVFGEALRSTRFGQMAISLDKSGRLASMSRTKGKAEFRVV